MVLAQALESSRSLLARYARVRSRSEALVARISPEDAQVQSMSDASPVKWHLAHTTWFFETFVLSEAAAELAYQPLNPRYRSFFNSYYEGVDAPPARAERGLWTRPSLAEVLAFRRHVDAAMTRLLGRRDGLPTDHPLAARVALGLAHEEQHQELLITDFKHALSCNPMEPSWLERTARSPAGRSLASGPVPAWCSHPGGRVRVGTDTASFGFDNEGPSHELILGPFELAQRLVTNEEWQHFIDEGGYRRPEFWLSDGWHHIRQERITAPLYHRDRGQVFTAFGAEAVDPGEAVTHISFYEADAYARFAGARLPTEFEWEVLARSFAAEAPAPPSDLGVGFAHPSTERAEPAAQLRPEGPGAAHDRVPQGLFGVVWQWTASPYLGYPNYRPAPGTIGEYNGKFMSNQMVLRGSSCATAPGHARSTYRNFFPPTARWQFTGLRLARSIDD